MGIQLNGITGDNTDYQEYLEWAKTNTAEAAD